MFPNLANISSSFFLFEFFFFEIYCSICLICILIKKKKKATFNALIFANTINSLLDYILWSSNSYHTLPCYDSIEVLSFTALNLIITKKGQFIIYHLIHYKTLSTNSKSRATMPRFERSNSPFFSSMTSSKASLTKKFAIFNT